MNTQQITATAAAVAHFYRDRNKTLHTHTVITHGKKKSAKQIATRGMKHVACVKLHSQVAATT